MTVALAAGAAAPAFGGQEPAASAAAPATPSRGGELSGTVQDPGGDPIPHAVIRVSDARGVAVSVGVTDMRGSFRILVPAGAALVVRVTAGRFEERTFQDVRAGAAQTFTLPIALEVTPSELSAPPSAPEVAPITAVAVLGLGRYVPAAYALVWHTAERGEVDGDEPRARPPLVDADDPETAVREARGRVDERDVFGDTALMFFAADAGTTKLLLESGASPNATDMFGATALMRAALSDDVEVVTLLLDAGADVNATDSAGLTALMVAAGCGNDEVVKALLAAGADVRAVDARGETALTYARAEKEKTVIKILRAAGAR